MKRQRRNIADHGNFTIQGATNAEDIMKKKSKAVVVVEKVEEEEEEEEEGEINNGVEKVESARPAALEVENLLCNWEERPWLAREVLDEQMSWGYISLPIWGVEFMAESYGSLFSDVAWDDDIWNLKGIKEIPANP